MKKYVTFIALLLLSVNLIKAQDFRSPFDFQMRLTGTFGELRGNHFHSGIDIKTRGSVGHPVYAIADGYVSRVKVRAYGFGHALYIAHPSGHTSVYGHLQRFSGELAEEVENRQYANESFTVEFYPSRDKYPVKKGDLIGYSGNSGSSGGPHLHFEIRDAANQKPSNALKYGYDVADNIAPLIQRLRFYPVGEGASINGQSTAQSIYVFKRGQNIKPKTSHIKASGQIAFGVQTYDQLNGAPNHNGPYRVTMYADSSKFWEFKADQFSFAETRYLNAMIDYASYKKRKQRFYQSYLKPGSKLSMTQGKDNGLIQFEPGQTRHIKIEVVDLKGNKSVVEFDLKGEEQSVSGNKLKGKLFSFEKKNFFSEEGVRLSVPKGALYDTVDFRYNYEAMDRNTYSKVHHLHNENTPLHKHSTLSVKVDRMVDNGLKDKLLLVRMDHRGRKHDEGGNWSKGWVSTSIRNLGKYVIMADTTKPRIRALNIYSGKTINRNASIDFRITDDLSGIETYRGEVDGKWVLFQYYPSKNRLLYKLDEKLESGKHTLKLVVTDEKQNQATYKADFTIQ
ncbi:MAG: M23 family metallopeptidase [Bacteroidota bacterium]